MINLDMKYKGQRNYLHGSDFFDVISSALSVRYSKGSIKKLTFKSFARNLCGLVLDEKPGSDQRVVGSGTWRTQERAEIKFWIIETKEPVVLRYSFDEDRLVAPSWMENNSIFLIADNEFSVIENVISLTKRLNYSLSPDVKGSWVFGQIDLLKPLPELVDQIQITRVSERGGAFSCNRILIDGEHVGEVRFIVGQP